MTHSVAEASGVRKQHAHRDLLLRLTAIEELDVADFRHPFLNGLVQVKLATLDDLPEDARESDQELDIGVCCCLQAEMHSRHEQQQQDSHDCHGGKHLVRKTKDQDHSRHHEG